MTKKILAVMSVIPGNGAKFMATNLASLFVNDLEEDEKILLLDFDFDHPYLAREMVDGGDDERTIDDLFPLLSDNLAENIEAIRGVAVETNIAGVDLLKGTRYAGLTKYIQPEQVQWTIEAASEIYKKVIIVISPSSSNVGTVYTLMKAEQLLVMLRQNNSNFEHVYDVMRIIRQYSTADLVKLVYNYDSPAVNVDFSEVFERLFVPIETIGTLSFDTAAVDNRDLLVQRRGFFQSKGINKSSFEDIYENLSEGDDE